MARTKAYRKYQLTINHPIEHGFSHDVLKSILATFPSLLYWCMSDETGEMDTYHTHLYIAFKNAVAFHTIQQRFMERILKLPKERTKRTVITSKKKESGSTIPSTKPKFQEPLRNPGNFHLKNQRTRAKVNKFWLCWTAAQVMLRSFVNFRLG